MKLYYVCVLMLVLFSSCMKEASDEFLPNTNNPANDTVWSQVPSAVATVNQLATFFAPPALTQTYNAATGDSVLLSPNCRVFVPANAAMLPNGQVATGPVRVELLQLKTKGDHVRNAKPTTQLNRLLEFAASFHIRLVKEGQELTLAPNKKLLIEFVEPNTTTNKQVFYGESNLPLPLPISFNPAFSWLPASDSSRVTVFNRTDSNNVVRGYHLTTGRLHWVSCQNYVDTNLIQRTRMDVILPPNFTNNNTSVYAVLKNEKTIVHLNGNPASKTFFAINIPTNKTLFLVSLTKIGEDLYLGTKEITPTQNSIQQLRPEKKTKAQIVQFLEQL